MSPELKILKLFCNNRSVYEINVSYVLGVKNLDREIRLLVLLIRDYYDKYIDTREINVEELKSFYDLQYPAMKDKNLHFVLMDEFFNVDVNELVIRDLLEQIIESHFAAKIVTKLVPVVEGNNYNILPSIIDDIDGYISLMRNPPNAGDIVPNKSSLKDIMIKESVQDGLGWHINDLNNIIGKVRKKTLGLVYAYVDAGKTSFSFGGCAGFAKQLVGTDQLIAYCGNEEDSDRLNFRLTQALTGKTRTEIMGDLDFFEEKRIKLGFNNVLLFDSINTIKDVKYVLDKYRPVVLILDQATKIDMALSDKEVQAVRLLFNRYRELAKEYDCAIIGVSQGTGDCENKKWLSLSDIYGSRVAIQGELDYAIGIGKLINDAARANVRYLNISKNKLHDGQDGKIVINFTKEKCLWKPI